MALVLGAKDAADWSYRGEGAANLVLAYTGSSPDFVGKVMRIHKSLKNVSKIAKNPPILSALERVLWKDVGDLSQSPTRDIAAQVYVNFLISPLLGPKHVDAGIRVHVSKEFLELVEKNALCQRPLWRVDAANIDTVHCFALIISDHSVFPRGSHKVVPCISVEIKPKCGFLPISNFITDENSIKTMVTRFRMHQVLKLREHEISELSEYDPLDLFSGSKDRIHKAIMSLFTTPQNNFRIFLNGSLIFGGLGGGTGATSFAIEEALEDILKCFIRTDSGLRTKSFLELVTDTVFKSGVLDRLLEVQKLDSCDIEGAIHAYYDVVSRPCMTCRELKEAQVSHRCASLHSIPVEESMKIVKDFLIASTAKDCSLMVSFRSKEEGDSETSYNDVRLESTKQNFEYKAHFIDMDLKPLEKMEYYYELDKKIVRSYMQMLKSGDGSSKSESVKMIPFPVENPAGECQKFDMESLSRN